MTRQPGSARQLPLLVLLVVAAVWGTLHSPTIFFDNQILLGSSLGVFALLQFGWRGLPVGLASALITVPLWGHPWAAVILVLQLLWQQLFLSRFNGGPEQLGNGRIVLATIAFWLVVGVPLKQLTYTGLLGADAQTALALGFKEAVSGVVNAALGLLLYLALQLLLQRRSQGDLSLRGLIFATLLLVISVPSVLIIMAMGQQLTAQTVSQFRSNLEQQAQAIAVLLPPASRSLPRGEQVQKPPAGLAFEAVASDGAVLSSDPALFASLRRDYVPETGHRFGDDAPTLLVRGQEQTVLLRHRQGYWWLQLQPASDAGWSRITVAQPALIQMQLLTGLMRPSLQILGLVLIAAALISELITSLLAAQLTRMLGPLAPLSPDKPNDAAPVGMPQLQRTCLRELNRIVTLINSQGHLVNQLSDELRQSHELLRQSERQHRLLADNALDVITISDSTGRSTYISPSIEKVRGWSVPEAMALTMEQHLKPEGCAYVMEALQQTIDAVNKGLPLPTYRVELEQSHKNGGWIWTDVNSSCIVDEQGRYIGSLIVYRDISERKRLEEEMLQRASIDALTGLLNRRELLEQLEALLTSARRRQGDELGVLFLDLDLFKQINDTLGHAAGDTVLRCVAERVRARLREGDLAGRMGGDEIVVVLAGLTDLAAATAVAEAIVAAIEQPIHGSTFEIAITASLGVTLARPGEAVDALMARADIAMYEAKQNGRRIVPIA
ncbi:diguanylate cyclase [Cyanobium sp. FGCU-6]|nr:diguanylate cyclase [Cyanobium sp. FGCU6]